jgi:hypothetical protein
MAGHTQGEGLARTRSPDHDGDALAALTQIADHRLLVGSGGRMRGQGLPHRLMGDPARLLAHPADSRGC